MAKFEVMRVKGDYPDRQEQANRAGAICYFEQHFNAREYHHEGEDLDDNPVMAIIAHNASESSKRWAQSYCRNVRIFCGDWVGPLYAGDGVLQRPYRARGDYNLRFTKMPAILGEPGWLSDLGFVDELTSSEQLIRLMGRATESSIREMFPGGGLVALSTGHAGKESTPFDRGAPTRGHDDWWEADWAERVNNVAEALLCKAEADRMGAAKIKPGTAREIIRLAARVLKEQEE